MAKGYDSLNDTFNTDDSVEVDAIVKAEEVIKPNDVDKDYDYTRGNLYSQLIDFLYLSDQPSLTKNPSSRTS